MDGLPGMKRGLIAAKRENVAPIKKMIGPFAPEQMRKMRAQSYTLEHILIVAMIFFLLGVGATLYGSTIADGLPILRKADTIPFLRHML
jgi:hypothetical protein